MIMIYQFLITYNYALGHEDVWGSGGIALPFLTMVIAGGEWSASRPGRFAYKETAPGAHFMGVWTLWGRYASLVPFPLPPARGLFTRLS
jgi:hypothetical protein